MKKNLFFALTMGVVMALGFAACGDPQKDPENGGEQQKGELAIVPAEITLAMGDTYRLNATLNGETVTSNVVWESSDAELVSVDQRGNIAASEEYSGVAEIKATVGEKSAVCKVTVQSFLETITFTNAFIGAIDTTVYEHVVREYAGYKYILGEASVYLFSEGFYLSDEGEFAGAEQAALIEFTAAIGYATPALNGGRGTIFVLGNWAINDSADNYLNTGEPGYIENEEAYTKYCFDGLHAYAFDGDVTTLQNNLKLAGNLCKGATLTELNYSYDAETGSGGYSSSFVADGFVTSADFVLNDNGFTNAMCGLQNVDIHVKHVDTETFWGLGADIDYELNEAKDDFTKFELVSKKVKWADSEYHYVYLPDAAPLQAPARGGMKLQPFPYKPLSAEAAAKFEAQLNAAKHFRK